MKNEESLIREYLPIAKRMARSRYRRAIGASGVTLDDYESDAMFGLLTAVRSFDAEKNNSLRSWVIGKIGFAILDGERSRSPLPRGVLADIRAGKMEPIFWHSTENPDENGDPLGESITDNPDPLPSELSLLVVGLLTDEQAVLVSLRFEGDLSLSEIGERLGVSVSRISQRLSEIKSTLRDRGEAACRELLLIN